MSGTLVRPVHEAHIPWGRHPHMARVSVPVELVALVVAVVGFATALFGSGGRDQGTTTIAVLLTVPLLVASRAWRRLSSREWWATAWVAVAAGAIPLVTVMGVADARDLNAYLLAPVAYLAVRAFATDAPRRRLLAALLMAVALLEYSKNWPVWLGEGNRSFRLVGTFYWHNQFGAFAAAICVFSLVIALRGPRVERWFAGAVAAVSGAMCFLSHSRGAELALVVGLAILALPLARSRAVRSLVAAGCCAAGAALVTGLMLLAVAPPRGNGGVVAAMTSTSLGSTSSFRIEFWNAASHVFASAPLLSHGFGSYGILSGRYLPGGAVIAHWAHSAPLQALTDGGLVLGLPVITVLSLFAWRALRRAWKAIGRRDIGEPTTLGAALAVVVLLTHTFIDFDLEYPVLVALLAIFAALASPAAPTELPGFRRVTMPAMVVLGVGTALGLALVSSYWTGAFRITHGAELMSAGHPEQAVATVAKGLDPTFTDPRAAIWLVQQASAGTPVPRAALIKAINESRAYSHLDSGFRVVWLKMHAALEDQPSR